MTERAADFAGMSARSRHREEVGVVNEEPGAEAPQLALFQMADIGGVTTFHFVRDVPAAEAERLNAANTFVRRIARSTPYHSLRDAQARLQESLAHASHDHTTEGPTVRQERCSGAFEDLMAAVVDHGAAWMRWVQDARSIGEAYAPSDGPHDEAPHDGPMVGQGGAPLLPSLDQAVEDFVNSPPARMARAVASAPDRGLHLLPGDEPDAVVQSESARLEFRLNDWAGDLSQRSILLADAGLRAMRKPLDAASRQVLDVWAEVMAGTAVIAPQPSEHGWEREFTIGTVDVQAARDAQSVALQARGLADQIRRREHENTPSPASPSSPAPSSREPAQEDGDADKPHGAETDGDASADLPTVAINLHRAIEAIAANVDGLSSQWAVRFDPEQFAQALETERALVSSLLQPLMRAMDAESRAASEAGIPHTLPRYPVPIDELPKWSSNAPAQQLWLHQSAATLLAFQSYLGALEQLGAPAKLSWAQGSQPEVEFEPLRAAALHASGRLLAELMEENAVTLTGLTGRRLEEFGVAPTHDQLIAQLVRAVRFSQSFGLPEASLVYMLRLTSLLDIEGGLEVEILQTARTEIGRYVAGEPASRGVALMLADAIAGVADAHMPASTSAHAPERQSSDPQTNSDGDGESSQAQKSTNG